jgi:deoxyribose-phosphate aldolase
MNRTIAELARVLDHSVLKPEASARDIEAGARLALQWNVGYYCVQPCWVRAAAATLHGSSTAIVAVIGFPHGCEASSVKAAAAGRAILDGARELDMVLPIGALKSGMNDAVRNDIAAVVGAATGIPVKVIIEAAALDADEKRRACSIAVDAGAAFVKTSTGFHAAGGATVDDVRLMRACVGPTFGVKASGGIRTLDDTIAMLDAGADRIGTSASASILAALEGSTPAR